MATAIDKPNHRPGQRGKARNLCYHQLLASAELGGGELVALGLAKHLAGAGRRPLIWTPATGAAEDFANEAALDTRQYPGAQAASSNRWSASKANLQLAIALRQSGAGLVHVHSPLVYGTLRWGLRLSRLPSIVHIHLDYDAAGLRWALRSPPDLIVTCARFLIDGVRQSLPPKWQDRVPMKAVPNAVDLERFSPTVDKLRAKQLVGAPLDRPLAVMLANLAPHKGQMTAIRAIASLRDRGIHVDLWLAGVEREAGVAYTNSLRQLIGELGIADRVRLLGQRDDAPQLLHAADCFLLPSTNEGLPLSILEAQASGVPVLAAPTAGVPEVVEHDQTGLLIAAHDAAGYAYGIETILSNHAHRNAIIERAFRQVFSQCAWSNYCHNMLAVYDELLPK